MTGLSNAESSDARHRNIIILFFKNRVLCVSGTVTMVPTLDAAYVPSVTDRDSSAVFGVIPFHTDRNVFTAELQAHNLLF